MKIYENVINGRFIYMTSHLQNADGVAEAPRQMPMPRQCPVEWPRIVASGFALWWLVVLLVVVSRYGFVVG